MRTFVILVVMFLMSLVQAATSTADIVQMCSLDELRAVMRDTSATRAQRYIAVARMETLGRQNAAFFEELEVIHEYMKTLPHKTLIWSLQAVLQGIHNTCKRELNGCEKGNCADVSMLQPHYAFDPKLFSNLHALYLCTRGEIFTAYDLSASGQKTPYMLEMLRLQRQKPQHFIVRMHLLNIHNEEVTVVSRLIDPVQRQLQRAPLRRWAESSAGHGRADEVQQLPVGLTPSFVAPHLVTYASRILNLSGTINLQALGEITSDTFSFEWLSALSGQEPQNLVKFYSEQKH